MKDTTIINYIYKIYYKWNKVLCFFKTYVTCNNMLKYISYFKVIYIFISNIFEFLKIYKMIYYGYMHIL